MTRHAVIDVRRAGPDDKACPLCPRPVETWQRLALVKDPASGHMWVHISCAYRHAVRLRQLANAGRR